jgi:predicted transposase/invertase (TIGR01784 family)
MPKGTNNIHDKFVRESFSDPDRAAASLRTILPNELSDQLLLDQLLVLKDSYIDNDLSEFFSDLVFEVPVAGDFGEKVDVVLLFEHKSAPDKHVLIQIGYYMFAHYFKAIKNKEKLKPIVPIIYYQGKRKWNAPQLWNLFESYPEEIKTYIPPIKHVFVALHSLSDATLLSMRNNLMAAAMITQKWKNNPEILLEEFLKVLSIFEEEIRDRNFFEIIFVYMLRTTELKSDSVHKLIEVIPPNVKENIMTTYNQIIQEAEQIGIQKGEQIGIQKGEQIGIQKGEQIGIQKGEQIGIQKKVIEVVLKSFKQGLSIDFISKITDLGTDEVKKILKEYNEK